MALWEVGPRHILGYPGLPAASSVLERSWGSGCPKQLPQTWTTACGPDVVTAAKKSSAEGSLTFLGVIPGVGTGQLPLAAAPEAQVGDPLQTPAKSPHQPGWDLGLGSLRQLDVSHVSALCAPAVQVAQAGLDSVIGTGCRNAGEEGSWGWGGGKSFLAVRGLWCMAVLFWLHLGWGSGDPPCSHLSCRFLLGAWRRAVHLPPQPRGWGRRGPVARGSWHCRCSLAVWQEVWR